jgi:hypothetical protein
MVAVRKLAAVPQTQATTGVPLAFEHSKLDPRAFTTLSTREEAEYLFLLDHSRSGPDSEWRAFFVESMVEFLIWQRKPWGVIREDDLDWLMGLCADAPSHSVPALLFALVRELNDSPERLTALALKHPKGRVA